MSRGGPSSSAASVYPLLDGAVIVSGGASGIGRQIAVEIGRSGGAVTVVDRRPADATVSEIRELGGTAHALVGDVADAKATERAVEAANARHGICTVLVNAAGVSPTRHISFLARDGHDWHRTMDVNAGGVFNLTHAMVRTLVREGLPGRVVNILSTAAFAGFAGMAAYCASKGAALLLTKTLAIELAPYRITVNGVAPGSIQTPMSDAFRADSPPAQAAAITAHEHSRTPLGSPGHPRDIAAAVRFLVSAEAGWVTGEVIVVDGGFMANGGPWFDESGILAQGVRDSASAS